jgi:hypothetical protein
VAGEEHEDKLVVAGSWDNSIYLCAPPPAQCLRLGYVTAALAQCKKALGERGVGRLAPCCRCGLTVPGALAAAVLVAATRWTTGG